jgi:hypothetical protein
MEAKREKCQTFSSTRETQVKIIILHTTDQKKGSPKQQ